MSAAEAMSDWIASLPASTRRLLSPVEALESAQGATSCAVIQIPTSPLPGERLKSLGLQQSEIR
jgi:hypothetical protein